MMERSAVRTAWTWRLVVANGLLIAGGFVVAAITAAHLPARYAVHFNFAGEPDRWARAGDFEWYVLPLIGGVLCTLLTVLGLALPRIPLRSMNMPRKEEFLRLSPAEQAPILRKVSHFVLLLALLICLELIGVQLAMFGSALRGSLGAYFVVPLATTIAVLGTVVGYTIHLARAIRRATSGPRSARP
jgi:uncharacterized membrane protein